MAAIAYVRGEEIRSLEPQAVLDDPELDERFPR
jgi:hypothetical protein